MVKFIRWYYWASALTVLALFLSAGVMFWSLAASAGPVLPPDSVNNVLGWAWSGNTGWISLNSKNCVDLNNITPGVCTDGPTYGLQLKVNNDGTGGVITGYAWSENMGWLCFGATCDNSPPTAPAKPISFTCKDNAGVTVTCDQVASASLSGWAKIINLGDQGWLRLSGDYDTAVVFGETSASSKLDGYMWQYAGGVSLAASYGVGWVRFAESPEVLFPYLRAEGGDIFSRGTIKSFFPPPAGIANAQYLIHVQGSSISSRFKTECNVGAICQQLNYSLIANDIDPTSEGPYNFKLGRFDFKGLRTVVSTVNGKAVNKYGNTVVMAAPNFANPLNNAVYFNSGDYTISSNIIIQNGNNSGGVGTVVVGGNLIINSNIEYSSLPAARQELASVAWIVLGDVKIDPSVTKLAGTYIVFGNLGVNVPKVCDGGGGNDGAICTDDSQCTSGGICIVPKFCYKYGNTDPGRDNLVCTDANRTRCNLVGGESCIHKCGAKQANGDLYDGCGKFVTGDPAGDNSQQRLVVSGTVFARQFKLLRSYIDVLTRAAAEKFIADGRIQLNPPPGMSDFAKGLPTFRR